jgi:hypothetical protein
LADRLALCLDFRPYLNCAGKQEERVDGSELMSNTEAVAALGRKSLNGAGRRVTVQIQTAQFLDYFPLSICEEGQLRKMRKDVGVTVAAEVPHGCFQ